MKKPLLFLLLFSLTFSVFSQEQILIGDRIVYSKNYGVINIFDAIDKKEYSINFKYVIENIYDINNRYGQRLITIDIYTGEITPFFNQSIRSWSSSSSLHAVWQQYASQIAERMTRDVREMYPDKRPPTPPSPTPLAPTLPAPPNTGSIQTITTFQPGMYYVQIGAYSNAAAARSEIEKVDSSLPRAIMQATVNIYGTNTNVNRVLIGPLNNAQSISVLQRYRFYYNDAFIHHRR